MSSNGPLSTQEQSLIRGAATRTVPNKVCSTRVRRSRIDRTLRQSLQTWAAITFSSIWLWTTRRCSPARSAFASSRVSPTFV